MAFSLAILTPQQRYGYTLYLWNVNDEATALPVTDGLPLRARRQPLVLCHSAGRPGLRRLSERAGYRRWLSGFGTARVRLDVDRHFTLKNSELDLLLPWYDVPEWVVFTQQCLHRTDDRTQMNLGAGVRHFGPEWMTGMNAFYDYDLTRYHQRAGLGAELWRDYLKLGANGYFRLSGWRDAPELNNDYEARPANGWDVRTEGWLPAYPQVGGKLTVEQYYGSEVALFGTGSRQKNPQAVTAGLSWTPVPLVTVSAEHSMGNGGINDDRFGLQLTWTPGVSLSRQLDPDAVRERRTLAGSRLDLVERNNNIVLEYRKKELIKLSLLARGRSSSCRRTVRGRRRRRHSG